jgi:hypothetical protein
MSNSRPYVETSTGDAEMSKSGPCVAGQFRLIALVGGHCQIHTSFGTICFDQRIRPSARSSASPGHRNKEIASLLRSSEETVPVHLKNIFAKLKNERTAAVNVALRRGIVHIE